MSTCKPLARVCVKTSQPNLLPRLQTRHESTTRRHRKLLIVPGAPSFTPSTPQPTLVFNPPSSAPNVYHTPLKFLPKDDRRRQMYASFLSSSTHAAHRTATPTIAQPGTPLHTTNVSPLNNAPTSSRLPPRPSSALPTPLRAPYEKTYHLTEADIKEIQRLRSENPDHWTRVRLAEKFGCSQFFVGMVAKNHEKATRVSEAHEAARARWGTRRREAREDRVRRKALWGRDA
ncbi:hypothetical protein DM02DRAFT_616974 [Periconia macrospinosa]|uniref:60S ribosomal protein L20 n=1 Tax=Periconia macrospinosa TaxID=97972 RepID=A0A2V1DF31_9PLEO|nr:hypothetical protein DM02DRAFT_616974 [Periconia macrospinosa]